MSQQNSQLEWSDLEKVFPMLLSSDFTRLKSIDYGNRFREADVIGLKDGWRVIGWTLSTNVKPLGGKQYVCMFKKHPEGHEVWCHVSAADFRKYTEDELNSRSNTPS